MQNYGSFDVLKTDGILLFIYPEKINHTGASPVAQAVVVQGVVQPAPVQGVPVESK